jgi:hypothetical protein
MPITQTVEVMMYFEEKTLQTVRKIRRNSYKISLNYVKKEFSFRHRDVKLLKYVKKIN